MTIHTSEYVRIRGFEFTGVGDGLRIYNSSNILVANNWLHDIDGTDNHNLDPIQVSSSRGVIDITENLFTNNFDRTNADTNGRRTENSRNIGAYNNDDAVLHVHHNVFVNDTEVDAPLQGSGIITKHGSDSYFNVDHNKFFQIAHASIGSNNARFRANHNLLLDSAPIVVKNFGGRSYYNDILIRNNTQLNSDGALIYRINYFDGNGVPYYDSKPIESFTDLGHLAYEDNIVVQRDGGRPTFVIGSYLGNHGPDVIHKVVGGDLLSFEGNVYGNQHRFDASWWRAISKRATPFMTVDSFAEWQQRGFDQHGINADALLNELFQPSNNGALSSGWYTGEPARLTIYAMLDDRIVIAPLVHENESLTFAIVRSGDEVNLRQPLTVRLQASVKDELTIPETVTFPAGESVARFPVTVLGDENQEATEAVRIYASSTSPFENNVDAWVRVVDRPPPANNPQESEEPNLNGQTDVPEMNLPCFADFRAEAVELENDLTDDGRVNQADGIPQAVDIVIGDVNLDGVFDSRDLIIVFQQGKYESGEAATWATGDWNCDGEFNAADLILSSDGYR